LLFNSFAFGIFLSTVLAAYWLLRRSVRAQNTLLLLASYTFYAWWDWRFVSLLLLSTLIDHTVATRIHHLANIDSENTKVRRWWLSLSVVANLGILGFFKYFDFFSKSLADALQSIGISVNPVYLNIILPVGISFYTFQTLSYTIDVYRRKMAPAQSLRDFALYVAFFPQLVAGPIERAVALIPQIEQPRRFDKLRFQTGAHLIFWGLFKKIYVADNLAVVVNRVFADPSATGLEVIVGIYAFAFQIYGDFSGYSDIARGSAKLMGFELMHNFAFPYISLNPSEFWRRWHISLSTWLRDYLYIPLGGSRGSTASTYRNLFATMLLGGLWHGATWMFVLWGAYQGTLLVIHRIFSTWWKGLGIAPTVGFLSKVPRAVLMFQFVCLGWLIFRAESIEQMTTMLASVVAWEGRMDFAVALPLLIFAGPLTVIEAIVGASRREALFHIQWIPSSIRAVIYGIILYLTVFHAAQAQSFIYFQF
jgi:alginate O-acetyltransferase complex protein AlgI